MNPTSDQWEEWRANPISEWFFKQFLRDEVRRTIQTAMAEAWNKPQTDAQHASYAARAETLAWLGTMTYSDLEITLAEQQEVKDGWTTQFPQ